MMQKNYLLTSICDKLFGPKYRVFVKLGHVKLIFWVKIFNWAQTETWNSSSTVTVIQLYFENRNISVGPLTTFSTVYGRKSVFHLISFIFVSGSNFDNINLKLDTIRNT